MIGLSLRPVRLTGKQEVAKRAFALVVGSILLLVTLPIWLAAELAIRPASPEPVFFQQESVTKGGRTFHMYKFRTMRDGITYSLDTIAPFLSSITTPGSRLSGICYASGAWTSCHSPGT